MRGIAARADAGGVGGRGGGVFVPELFGRKVAEGSGGRAEHRVKDVWLP